MTQPRIFALIVAAGVGARAGGDVPKQYARIGGKALLAYSIEALARHPSIAGVQVVIHADHADLYDAAVGLGAVAHSPGGGRLGWGPNEASASPMPPPQPSPSGGGPLALTRFQAAPLLPKLLPPVVGGAQRADSVRAGLLALSAHAPDYVLIHDAARPFLAQKMIGALIEKLMPDGAAVAALAVADTVRRYTNGVWEEVPRDGLLRVQTPQAFAFGKLVEVMGGRAAGAPLPAGEATRLNERSEFSRSGEGDYPRAAPCPHPDLQPSAVGVWANPTSPKGEVPPAAPLSPTDEAAIWLAAGLKLAYVPGDEELRKVTTAEDITWAEKKIAATRRVAVGMGYDVHALVPAGDAGVIRLGGIDIAHSHKLHGHSDADVVLHAVVDALLGTIAAGDIGSHFPPTDARWKGANSAIFIEEARAQVAARGGEISHIDITLICEAPKVAPHREAIREAVAAMLKLPLARVSVKATTTEKLGFTGRQEGIACHAVATVSLPMEEQ